MKIYHMLAALTLMSVPVSAQTVTNADIVQSGDQGFLWKAKSRIAGVNRTVYAFCSTRYPAVMIQEAGRLRVERVLGVPVSFVQPLYSTICYDSRDWKTEIGKGGYSPRAFNTQNIKTPEDILQLP
jgi:hypothetical protein